MTPDDAGTQSSGPEVPAESVMLKAAYKQSGLTVADLVAATGIAMSSVQIALNGIRYRQGEPRLAVPSDRNLVKLAAVLNVSADQLRSYDRSRAAQLLEEAHRASNTVAVPSERDAQEVAAREQASAAGRAALAQQILTTFSTEELHEELQRRERAEHDKLDQEGIDDAAADLKADLGVL